MIFSKLKAVKEALAAEFSDHTVTYLTPQPPNRAKSIMVGGVNFDAPQETWGSLRKKGRIPVVMCEALREDIDVFDDYISRVKSAVETQINKVDITGIDYIVFYPQRLFYIYVEVEVEWIA